MFRIESYITPIILNYVAKYVKDIRSEDAQVSLWEGEVAFQNLDMRLDVLEEELNLPFEFLSGHIQALSIQVPWTKITSEPIRITINTIEFVLKLKTSQADGTGSDSTSAGSSPQRSREERAKRKRPVKPEDQQQAQQSAGSGLVNKIINNIVVQCHNIILKYVEEDIVVSMNVQLLSFSSADENWKSAMVDVHPLKVLMRKLVKISDLTICLDKRNAAGQIEVCQEPIIYRCTIECRIMRKYHINTMATTSTTRIGIFTKSLDVNVSSLQFPMVMRLINLLLALKTGKIQMSTSSECYDDEQEDISNVSQAASSYLSWAWSMLPTFNFEQFYEEEAVAEPPGHTRDIGIYVEELTFTLKNSEFVVDTMLGTMKRIRYSPIIRVTLGGMYYEGVSSEEHKWNSAKAGLSSLCFEPLGTYRNDNYENAIIQSEELQDSRSFIDKSLFDEHCPVADKTWGITNYEEYSTRFTDEYLLYRTPILAFDLVEYKSSTLDNKETASVASEEVNDDIQVQYRLLSSGLTFRYGQSFLQVKQIITDFIESYDYPAYYAEGVDVPASSTSASKLHPPLMEDYDALMQHVPCRIYKFKFQKINMEIYPKIEPEAVPKPSRRTSGGSATQKLMHFALYFDEAKGTLSTPLLPDKLVHTTCQLPNKPAELLDACYDNYQFTFSSCALSLVNRTMNHAVRLVDLPHLGVQYSSLLQPHLWTDNDIATRKFDLNCEQIIIEFSKCEFTIAQILVKCIQQYDTLLLWKIARASTRSFANADKITLQNCMRKFELQLQWYPNYSSWNACLRELESLVMFYTPGTKRSQVVLSSNTDQQNTTKPWLQLYAQFPREENVDAFLEQGVQSAVAMWAEELRIAIDNDLVEFLKCQDLTDLSWERESSEIELQVQSLQPPLTPSNVTNTPIIFPNNPSARRTSRNSLTSRKILPPEETVHFSSERDDKVDMDPNQRASSHGGDEPNVFFFKYFAPVVFNVEIGKWEVLVAGKHERDTNGSIISDYTRISCPKILCKSLRAEYIRRISLEKVVKFPLGSEDRSNLNWTLELDYLGVQQCNVMRSIDILKPVRTTFTIAISHKMERAKSKSTDSVNQQPSRSSSPQEGTGSVAERKTSDKVSDSREKYVAVRDDSLPPTPASLSGRRSEKDMRNSKIKRHIRIRDEFHLNLYVDTAPIHFFVKTAKAESLQNDLRILLSIWQLIQPPTISRCDIQLPETASKQAIEVVTATEHNASLKEFLDLDTNSESSKFTPDPKAFIYNSVIVSLFCQWTITKIIFELQGEKDLQKSKVILELEDLLSTVDQHEDYTKYTSKVGNFNLNYYEQQTHEVWKSNEALRAKLLGDSTNASFVNIVFTCAGLRDFYKKVGIKRKSSQRSCISEILIEMQGIDIILDLLRAQELLAPFCPLFQKSTEPSNTKSSSEQNDIVVQRPLTAVDLPMIHLDSNGLRLCLPLQTGRENCSVFVWQVGHIKISPNLDNPLQRNPIRIDVYSKAAQMGILGTPGSVVEDRQYELTLKNMSAASGNWSEILNFMREQSTDFLRTNPAFEWNNPNRKTALQLTDIFNNFTFIAIYAPSITYNNVLICGQAIEFNSASDFIATLNTHQLNLISCLLVRLQNIRNLVARTCHKSKSRSMSNLPSPPKSTTKLRIINMNKESGALQGFLRTTQSWNATKRPSLSEQRRISSFHSIDEDTEPNLKTDSGFQSCNSQLSSNERFGSLVSNTYVLPDRPEYPAVCAVRQMPHTVSLVAGVFIIQIYDIEEPKETAAEPKMTPLLLFTISQPSFMITQNIYDLIVQVSLFDISINMAALQMRNTEKQGYGLFPEEILRTRPGALDTTGIPPPLVNIKLHFTKMLLLELDAEMSKAIVVILNEKCAQQLFKYMLILYSSLLENPCFEVRSKTPVTRGSKIKLMRQQCFNVDLLHFKAAKFIVKYTEKSFTNKLVCADLNLNIKFIKRPEKATVKGSIGAFYLKTDQKILLHPILLRVSGDFVSEPWHRLPLVTGTIKFNMFRLEVTPKSLVLLQEAMLSINRLSKYTNEEWERFLSCRPQPTDSIQLQNNSSLTCLKCPCTTDIKYSRESCGRKKLQREEFYQDDLRAGAFQIVEMVTDAFLPLPYQIQIIKKNFGIICWRYPQPRKMCKIHVFPVPMAVSNPIHIKCRMEYFSETHECFRHYCDFWLSETVSREISLPDREICANIWRVVIMQSLVSVNGDCFDTNDEAEEELRSITSMNMDELLTNERKESDFILHPKVLVCCMRVDTCFQSACVPKVQLLVSCNLFQVKLLNQPNENVELPPILKKFHLTRPTQIGQAFLVLDVEKLKINAAFQSLADYTTDTNFTFNIKCLDYGYLNMLYLIDRTAVECYIHVNQSNRNITTNFVLDRLRINFGPSIIHSLLTSKIHWEENLDPDKNRKRHALIPKYIIINRTYSFLSFGQTGTSERINLHSRESHLYSFRSDFHRQELTFFIVNNESLTTEVSESVRMPLKFKDDVMVQTIRAGNKCLVIKSCKLSATQIYVMIKGQIELMSMVPNDLRIEFRREDKRDETKRSIEYVIGDKGRGSFFYKVNHHSNISMRMRFANDKGKARTGDIPLRTNKNLPWLVKVPTTEEYEFITLWVRVLREDISELFTEKFQPQKILITIWPVFVVSSRLNRSLAVIESITNEQYYVMGEGGRTILNLPVTHVSEHQLTFQSELPISEKSQREVTLSLKAIDWYKFFWYDEEKWTIDYALQELSKGIRVFWPLNCQEELRVKRFTNNARKIEIEYKCQPTREFSCAMGIEASPWAIFINSTGINVQIVDVDRYERLKVDANSLEMMPAVQKAFTVNVPNSSSWIDSWPIYFSHPVNENKNGKYYVLSENSTVDILILRGKEVMKFMIEFVKENGRKVFKLHSKFVVTNFTKKPLCILPVAMDHKETATRAELNRMDDATRKCDVKPAKSLEQCIGRGFDYFFDIKACTTSRSYDTAFIFFVCIKICLESDISIPIPLSMAFARRCFSIQNGEESVPLVVTLIEKRGIFYLNIFEDNSPAILITNNTDVKFIVAQTNAAENSKVNSTTREYDGRHFEWQQTLPGHSNCYYTPPEMYANFPDVDCTTCNLTLALYKDECKKNELKWSKPIRTDKSWEKFLHIPNHGDVKVIICDKHRVILVSIYFIKQQLEFSVKDLRSRLLTPQSSQEVDKQSDVSIATIQNVTIAEHLSSSLSPRCDHFRTEPNNRPEFKIRFYAKEIVICLQSDSLEQDCMKSEVFGMYIDDFMLSFDNDDNQRRMNVIVSNLQIDNQLYSTGRYDFPVVLCAEELYPRNKIIPQIDDLDIVSTKLLDRPPMIFIILDFFDDELKLRSIACRIRPVRIYIEDAYLNTLLESFMECEPSHCVYQITQDIRRITLKKSQVLLPKDVVAEAVCIAEPFQLRSFRIEALNLMLSVHTSVRLYIALDHSPLSFSAYERQHILTVPLRFGQSLGMHYLSGALFGAGWVVGSLEILGSPSGLARSFSTGLRDFVSMPVQGLFRGPWGFIVGITQGSASLLRNVTAGTVNSLTKLAASVARNLDRLTLDEEHIERTEALRRCRPQGFTEGLSQGITGLGISILGAVGGLAHHTLEARNSVDVITGVGKGIVGALTKPISGAAELVALAGQGVLQTVGFNALPQLRHPSVCHNVSVEPSAYRIWNLLPSVLLSDQILFYQPVMLVVNEQTRQAFVLLTSTVFAMMEMQWDHLAFAFPVEKVDITRNRDDKTLFYVKMVTENEDIEENLSFTNQRIMTFLHSSHSLSSGNFDTTVDSFHDLLQKQTISSDSTAWAFYIDDYIGEHIIQYIQILNRKL